MTGSGQRYLAKHHIRRPCDFKRVYDRRRSASDGLIVVYACENDLDHPRLGLSVSRRVGGAITRNRWKRLIREAFRLGFAKLPVGVDLVVIPRLGVEPSLVGLAPALVKLATRAAEKLGPPPGSSSS